MRSFAVWDCCSVRGGSVAVTMSRRNVEKQTILFYSVHPTHPPPPKPPKVVAPGVKSPQSGTFGLLAQILVFISERVSVFDRMETSTNNFQRRLTPNSCPHLSTKFLLQLTCRLPSNATHSHGYGTSRLLRTIQFQTPFVSLHPSSNSQDHGPGLTRAATGCREQAVGSQDRRALVM